MVQREVPGFVARTHHALRELTTPVGRHNRQKEWAVVKSLPSTVSILAVSNVAKENGEREGSIGSGFVVVSRPTRGGVPGQVIIATNRHVIETSLDGSANLQVITSGAQGDARKEELKQTFANAEVAYVSKKHDLAFVRLSLAEHPEVVMPALKLGHSTLVDVPDTLLSIGAPLGVEDTVTELHVSQNNLTEVPSEEGTDFYRQVSLINPGNSGGAAIDPVYAGVFGAPRVIGMPTLGAKDNPTLGYILPVETIASELAVFLKGEQATRRRAA